MNPSRSLSAASSTEPQDLSPVYGVGHDTAVPTAPSAEAVPSVGRLFARLFGGKGAEGRNNTFAATEWQATEWQDTRTPPADE